MCCSHANYYTGVSHHGPHNWSTHNRMGSLLWMSIAWGLPAAALREYRDESTTRYNRVHFLLPTFRARGEERRGAGRAAATTLSKNAIKGSFRRNSGAKGRRRRRGRRRKGGEHKTELHATSECLLEFLRDHLQRSDTILQISSFSRFRVNSTDEKNS